MSACDSLRVWGARGVWRPLRVRVGDFSLFALSGLFDQSSTLRGGEPALWAWSTSGPAAYNVILPIQRKRVRSERVHMREMHMSIVAPSQLVTNTDGQIERHLN